MNGNNQEKDAYYFSHDANARNDHKITKLMIDLKSEGYGIYWVVIEMLREQKNYMLNKIDYEAIAYQSHSNRIAIAKVIEEYNLFSFDDNGNFWSDSLLRRMKSLEEKRLKLSAAGKRGNLIRWQSPGNRKAIAVKESKVKESKVNKEKKETTLSANAELTYPFLKSEGFKKEWEGWLEVRKRLKAPNTNHALELSLKKLHTFSEPEAIKMLEQSIERGWRGVFQVKAEEKPKTIKL